MYDCYHKLGFVSCFNLLKVWTGNIVIKCSTLAYYLFCWLLKWSCFGLHVRTESYQMIEYMVTTSIARRQHHYCHLEPYRLPRSLIAIFMLRLWTIHLTVSWHRRCWSIEEPMRHNQSSWLNTGAQCRTWQNVLNEWNFKQQYGIGVWINVPIHHQMWNFNWMKRTVMSYQSDWSHRTKIPTALGVLSFFRKMISRASCFSYKSVALFFCGFCEDERWSPRGSQIIFPLGKNITTGYRNIHEARENKWLYQCWKWRNRHHYL